MNELMQSGLAKSGLDFAELEQLYRQSKSEFAEQSKRDLAGIRKHSASLSGSFEHDLKSLRARLSDLKNLAPLTSPVNLTLINTASNITSDQISLSATNLAPLNNSAQFDYSTRDTSSVTLAFVYDWTNATDHYVVVNVLGFISFNGIVVASTDGSFWPIDHQHCHNAINAYLSVTNPSGAVYQGGYLNGPTLNADSGGGWLGNPGVYETATVFRGLPPSLEVITVPPQAGLQISVVGQFYSDIDSGYAEYNFKDEGRQVTSAGVIVSVVS